MDAVPATTKLVAGAADSGNGPSSPGVPLRMTPAPQFIFVPSYVQENINCALMSAGRAGAVLIFAGYVTVRGVAASFVIM